MFDRYRPVLETIRAALGWLLTAYLVYLFFLYLWSTFERFFSKGVGFILALIITAALIGYLGWKYIPTRKGD